MSDFDRFSQEYDEILARNLSLGGGDPDYFHRGKALTLRRVLGPDFRGRILDFGCGVGHVLDELTRLIPAAELHGYDPSVPSAKRAAGVVGVASVVTSEEELEAGAFDAAVVANVLHHVDPPERPRLVRSLHHLLRDGGTVVVFEHNPLNPLTRWTVRQCPFDVDVELLWGGEVAALLRDAGFGDVRFRYTTFFPRWFGWLRRLERFLGWLPLGAQTYTVGRSPRSRRGAVE